MNRLKTAVILTALILLVGMSGVSIWAMGRKPPISDEVKTQNPTTPQEEKTIGTPGSEGQGQESLGQGTTGQGQIRDTNQINFGNVKIGEIKTANLIKLTTNTTSYSEPRFSSDGKLIAFRKRNSKGIFILNLESNQENKLEGAEDSTDGYKWDVDGIKFKDKYSKLRKVNLNKYKKQTNLIPISLKGKLVEKNNTIYINNEGKKQLIAPWGKNPEVLDDGSIRYKIDEDDIYIVFDGLNRKVQEKLISNVHYPGGKQESKTSYYYSDIYTCSPDGTYLICADLGEDEYSIISSTLTVRKIGTKDRKKLIDLNGYIPHYPDWSNDGKKVIFSDEKKGHIYSFDIKINK